MPGWQDFAALLAAEQKKKEQPQYSTLSQAAISPMGGPAPVLDPTAALQTERAPAAGQGLKNRNPARVAAPGMPAGMQNFKTRTAGSEMDAIRALWDRQLGDVDKTRSQADDLEKAPQKTDLSALAGLTAAWGGDEGKAAATMYEKPMKAEERAKMVAQLRNLADDNERGISSERTKVLLGGDKSDTALIKALIAGQNKNQPNWRTDRLINTAVDSIHKAPNLKTYTDMANSVAEGQYLLSKPDVTVTEANEALTTLTRAIGRTNISSDYRQKQLETKTLKETIAKLKTFIKSDPDQPAPPEVVKLYQKMGGRVLDTYDASIKREAKRMAQGKRFTQPEVNDAVSEAVDHYASGRYMQELRDTYQLPKSELGHKNVQAQEMARPSKVSVEDWNSATPEEKAALSQAEHLK